MKKVMMLITLTLMLTACHMMTPDLTTKQFLGALKRQDKKMIVLTYGGKLSGEDVEDAMDDLEYYMRGVDLDKLKNAALKKMSQFDYAIVSAKTKDKTSHLRIRITTYALGSLALKWADNYESRAIVTRLSGGDRLSMKKKSIEHLTSSINKLKNKNYTRSVTITLKKTHSWKVQELNEETRDALSGGLLSAVRKLRDQ